jgi:hypothetical protein
VKYEFFPVNPPVNPSVPESTILKCSTDDCRVTYDNRTGKGYGRRPPNNEYHCVTGFPLLPPWTPPSDYHTFRWICLACLGVLVPYKDSNVYLVSLNEPHYQYCRGCARIKDYVGRGERGISLKEEFNYRVF